VAAAREHGHHAPEVVHLHLVLELVEHLPVQLVVAHVSAGASWHEVGRVRCWQVRL